MCTERELRLNDLCEKLEEEIRYNQRLVKERDDEIAAIKKLLMHIVSGGV